MSAEARGVVVAFDEARGFGFIRSPRYAEDVFVHVSAVEGGDRLSPGQRVTFEAEPSERGPRALRVRPGARGLPPGIASAALLVVAVAVAGIGLWRVGLPVAVAWLVPINMASLGAWVWDKHRSVRDGRRIPEAVLLGLATIGGTIGAIVGVLALRHKRRKPKFLVVLALIAVGQTVALVAVLVNGR